MVIIQPGNDPILIEREPVEFGGHEWIVSGAIEPRSFTFLSVIVHSGPIGPEDRYQRMLKALAQTIALVYVRHLKAAG